MQRRKLITGLAGAAVLPVAARAQRPERVPRIGVLMTLAADDLESNTRLDAFLQRIQQMGWINGRNVRIDVRWGAGDSSKSRKLAEELIALSPDVILANGSAAVSSLLQSTRTLPVVFTSIVDPVGGGFVNSLARPGGNVTGFTLSEHGTSAKWLELLKEIAPNVMRVAVLRDPVISSGNAQLDAIKTAALSFGQEVQPIDVRDAGEIELALTQFAGVSNGGLIVTAGALANAHRDLIISLAARLRLPAVYFQRFFVAAGGLISYGVDFIEQYRQAAGYVDRILKGEKPADLPVQAPTKYQLAINLNTARALGLDLPPTLLIRADEVIE